MTCLAACLQVLDDEGVWPDKAVLDMMLSVLAVLRHVHNKGVLHRDIKAANVMRREVDGRFYVIDFGASSSTAESENHKAIGTPGCVHACVLACLRACVRCFSTCTTHNSADSNADYIRRAPSPQCRPQVLYPSSELLTNSNCRVTPVAPEALLGLASRCTPPESSLARRSM